jgi:hypothetical protein
MRCDFSTRTRKVTHFCLIVDALFRNVFRGRQKAPCLLEKELQSGTGRMHCFCAIGTLCIKSMQSTNSIVRIENLIHQKMNFPLSVIALTVLSL